MSNTQEFYRNLEDLVSNEGIEVDAYSLWRLLNNETMVLVDADQFVSQLFDDNFIKAE